MTFILSNRGRTEAAGVSTSRSLDRARGVNAVDRTEGGLDKVEKLSIKESGDTLKS